MSKLIYVCDNCGERVVKDIVFQNMDAKEMDGFMNNLMNVNGFYPEIERFITHICPDHTIGVARLAGIKLEN